MEDMKTKLDICEEEIERTNNLSRCEDSDGAFWTLMITLVFGAILITFVSGWNESTNLAFGITTVIFMCLGGGFFANLRVDHLRHKANANYNAERARLVRMNANSDQQETGE